ncbi:hypothetical protein I4U23_012297 [Adineta vaga]|nr:hypothetical protein I4U23_012297 [Adineta vaga]
MDTQTTCIRCRLKIDTNQYSTHLQQCFVQEETNPYDLNVGQCPLCNKIVKNLLQHCQTCQTDNKEDDYEMVDASSLPQNDSQTVTTSNRKFTRDCIWCFKPIAEIDYVAHVQACVPQSPDDINSTTTNGQTKDSCLNCASAISHHDGSAFQIDVRLVMSTVCIYRRLLTLVQNQKRPQCSRCHFYIDPDTIGDFDQHVDSCDLENAIPCNYCHCPYGITLIEEHVRQCCNEPMHRQQKLVEFLLPHTKYPFSAQQIDFFIETQKKYHRPIDARSIVEALAEFDNVFPLELPSRLCDICMESYLYDDIYVFGCPDSHKLCYNCYETSCRTKMNNNEVITCGICSYQLPYGELRQLRILPAEQDKFVQYQVQKTFERYAGSGRGVIKCPNQNFCRLCNHEFCSLCNDQYHYRTNCQQLAEITQQWYFWCNTERGRYLQTRAREDAVYAARLKEFEREQKANRARNVKLQQTYKNLLADEKYKETNCRLCPHCNRVVQHMGGCASMICGQDYHGGNNQSGCGQSFTWNDAKKYVPTTDRKPEDVMPDFHDPKTKLVVHENITCDGCHETVRGIRFDCIHCPSLIYCEKCEQKLTLQHSNQNDQERKRQHVFQLIMAPDT